MDAHDYAHQLIDKHGLEGAISKAYAHGQGVDSADEKRCDRLAAEGEEHVLRARNALDILRSQQQEQQEQQAMKRGRSW